MSEVETFTKRDAIKSLKECAKKNDGYLTPELYLVSNLNPPVKWITEQFGSFDNALKESNIFTQKEYEIQQSKIQIVKNFKLIAIENNGIVTQVLYKKNECKPSVDYISKHFGWEEMIREANVKPHSQLMNIDDLLNKLKLEIKKLGYIPTRDEYEKLSISPSVDSLSTKGVPWTEAMRKVGYNTYGKPVKVKDKICLEEGCYNQFTPIDDQTYCDNCYKDMRIKLMKKIDKLNSEQKHKDIIRKLTYGGNGDRIIKEILESI